MKYLYGHSLLSMVGKLHTAVLVDRVRRMTEGLTDDERGVSDQGGVCGSNLHSKGGK